MVERERACRGNGKSASLPRPTKKLSRQSRFKASSSPRFGLSSTRTKPEGNGPAVELTGIAEEEEVVVVAAAAAVMIGTGTQLFINVSSNWEASSSTHGMFLIRQPEHGRACSH